MKENNILSKEEQERQQRLCSIGFLVGLYLNSTLFSPTSNEYEVEDDYFFNK